MIRWTGTSGHSVRPMSLRRVLLLLLSLLLGCTALTLPPNRPLARPVAFRGAYEEFPSGLRLVVHEAPHVSRVTMNVSYRVGATDEPAGKEGLAHLVEHLTFQARPGGERAPRLASLLLASGAEFNAVTSYDGTDYFFSAPPEQLSRLAALEAERLRAPLQHVTEEDFRVARDVVVAELRQRYETSPEGAQQRWLHEVLLPGHPYGRTSGGTPESLQQLTLEDARAFVQAHYTPAHVVVVVSGPQPTGVARSTVALGFAKLTAAGKQGPTPPVRRAPPPFPQESRARAPMRVRSGPVEYPRLWLVWTVPGLYSGMTPQAFAAEGMLHNRLATQLAREEQAHSSSVTLEVLDGVTLLIARIDLMRVEDAEDVADLALDQLVDLYGNSAKLGGLTLAARSSLLTEAFRSLEQFPAREAARFLRATGTPDYVQGWPQQIREGLSRDLGPYLYKYVRRERARMLLMVPEQAGSGSPTVAERFAPLAGPEDFGDEELTLPPGASDVRQVARPPGLNRAERFTLGNGLRVVALRREGMPLLEARLWVRTRTPSTEGALSLSRLAVHGSYMSAGRKWYHGAKVGARTALQLREEGQPLLSVSAPSGNLIHVLEDMQQWMWDAEVEPRPFEDVQAWQVRELEREASRSDVRAERGGGEAVHRVPGHAVGGDGAEPGPVHAPAGGGPAAVSQAARPGLGDARPLAGQGWAGGAASRPSAAAPAPGGGGGPARCLSSGAAGGAALAGAVGAGGRRGERAGVAAGAPAGPPAPRAPGAHLRRPGGPRGSSTRLPAEDPRGGGARRGGGRGGAAPRRAGHVGGGAAAARGGGEGALAGGAWL